MVWLLPKLGIDL